MYKVEALKYTDEDYQFLLRSNDNKINKENFNFLFRNKLVYRN